MTNFLDIAINKGREEGLARGRAEGREEGWTKGREETRKEYEAILAEKERAMKDMEQELRELKLRFGQA